MRLRIASWNVRGMPQPVAQLRLLADQHPDILLLQDVGPSAMRAVVADSHVWKSMVDSWSLLHCDSDVPRRGGCLVAAADGWSLESLSAALDAPSPHRSLAATATHDGIALTVFSCYAPTNTGPGRIERPAYFAALAAWLSTMTAPVVLGMDGNGPRIDHPDPRRSVWWNPEEEALVLGAGAPTSDALRLWYASHPVELKRRVQYYPNGPLADSYHRGRKGKYMRCRYDSIRVSPGITVTDVRYLYEEGVQAGSDHALVVADIDLP